MRESLSGVNKEKFEFPEDAETWPWSLQIEHLESIPLLIAGGDIQVHTGVYMYAYIRDPIL